MYGKDMESVVRIVNDNYSATTIDLALAESILIDPQW
jgi:hypothetical protein